MESSRQVIFVSAPERGQGQDDTTCPRLAIVGSTVFLGITIGLSFLSESLHTVDNLDSFEYTEPPVVGLAINTTLPTMLHTSHAVEIQQHRKLPEVKIVVREPSTSTAFPFLCLRPPCQQLGKAIAQLVSREINPCDNFAGFACSLWNHTDDDVLDSLESMAASALMKTFPSSLPSFAFKSCVGPSSRLFESIANTYMRLTNTKDWPYTEPVRDTEEEISTSIGSVYRELGTDTLFRFTNTGYTLLINWEKLPDGLPSSYFSLLNERFTELVWFLMGKRIPPTDRSVSSVALWLTESYKPSCNPKSSSVENFIHWSNVLNSAMDGKHRQICYPVVRPNMPPASSVMNYIVFRMLMALTPLIADDWRRKRLASFAYARVPGRRVALSPNTSCVRFLDRFDPGLLAEVLFEKTYFGHRLGKVKEVLNNLKAVLIEEIRSNISSPLFLERVANITISLFSPTSTREPDVDKRRLQLPFFYSWLRSSTNKHEKIGLFISQPKLLRNQTLFVPALSIVNVYLHPEDDSIRVFLIPRAGPRVLSVLYQRIVEMTRDFRDTEQLVGFYDGMMECLRQRDLPSGATASDIVAIRLSLRSYLRGVLKFLPDHRLHGAEQFDAKQLFFVLYAVNACGQSRNKHKVNAILKHLREFQDAFECPEGSFMNPLEKCA
ncbi:uncharacterized protein LOC135398688 [Ornithodoros turicata]|uniref:uncharacterized protein LOC135398688 n=1 Tax=Ornithodoros turicata TaxID=34597 RepID=UPI003138D3C1